MLITLVYKIKHLHSSDSGRITMSQEEVQSLRPPHAPVLLDEHVRSSNDTLTTWDDFNACGVTKSDISAKYKSVYGTAPDAVHLNDSFTDKYGWDSFNKQLGDMQVANESIAPMFDVAYDDYTKNGDPTHTYEDPFEVTASHNQSATVSVTQTSSIGYNQTISIGAPELGLGSEFSTSFDITNTSGSSSSTSTTITITKTARPYVPPMSKVRVTYKLRWTSKTATWKIPIEIDPSGVTGAQFPKTVAPPDDPNNKHYYWALDNSNFGTLRSFISGKLDASYDIKGELIYGPPEPYDPAEDLPNLA